MDDRDEGESFVETLGFKDEKRESATLLEPTVNTGRGGYKRRAYNSRK
jgi:hypothetical protein